MEDGIESKKTEMYAFTEWARGERQIWGAHSLQKKNDRCNQFWICNMLFRETAET